MATIADLTFDACRRRGISFNATMAIFENESGMNPSATSAGSSATGLGQILSGTRDLYNQREGKAAGLVVANQAALKDPATNIRVATWLLRTIADLYAATCADAKWKHNWANRDYVECVSLGYTAGWSDMEGVAGIIRRMTIEKRMPRPTADQVIKAAGEYYPLKAIYNRGGGYMSDPALSAHIHSVGDDAFSGKYAATIADNAAQGCGG